MKVGFAGFAHSHSISMCKVRPDWFTEPDKHGGREKSVTVVTVGARGYATAYTTPPLENLENNEKRKPLGFLFL